VSLLTRLQNVIGFTRTEAQVLLFLSVTFLLGIGVRLYKGAVQPDIPIHRDYAAADSVFGTRSAGVLSGATARTSLPQSDSGAALQIGSINLNAADKEELMRLPGIGPVYAERIIAFRGQHGRFRSIDDLEKVKGIGPKKLAKLRPYLRLD